MMGRRAGVLALVPARSGSRGVPGKNLQRVGGRSLIAHAIDTAWQSGAVGRVLVSTDDPAIARAGIRAGAEVPWLRPASLARSATPMIDVVLHALDALERDDRFVPDSLVLLQPTSPFRTASVITRGLRLHRRARGASVVAVSPASDHPYWCKRINRAGVLTPFVDAPVAANRQALPPAFRVNGALYIATPATLRRQRSFYSPSTRAIILNVIEGLDIDTPLDLRIARALCRQGVRA